MNLLTDSNLPIRTFPGNVQFPAKSSVCTTGEDPVLANMMNLRGCFPVKDLPSLCRS